jgi:hypothetical protein
LLADQLEEISGDEADAEEEYGMFHDELERRTLECRIEHRLRRANVRSALPLLRSNLPYHHLRAGPSVVTTDEHQFVYAGKGKGGAVINGISDIDDVRAKIAKLRGTSQTHFHRRRGTLSPVAFVRSGCSRRRSRARIYQQGSAT